MTWSDSWHIIPIPSIIFGTVYGIPTMRIIWSIAGLHVHPIQAICNRNKQPDTLQGKRNTSQESETCTFSLLTFWEAWGRATQTPSSLFWHNATAAVTGQTGSHDSVSSSGSKLIPNHSSSRPAGRRGHNLFKLCVISFVVLQNTISSPQDLLWLRAIKLQLTVFEGADLDSGGIHHSWPTLLGI